MRTTGTAEKLTEGAASLLMRGGYDGFSYADLAERFGIRKASIHHHFPSKVDLVVAVVESGRTRMREHMAAMDEHVPDAIGRLERYTGHWKQCIRDQTAPFCLVGILAAELPGLPSAIADAVRGHFADLRQWVARTLEAGMAQNSVVLSAPPALEADTMVAGVYGAMLLARVSDDPACFAAIVDPLLDRIRASARSRPAPPG